MKKQELIDILAPMLANQSRDLRDYVDQRLTATETKIMGNVDVKLDGVESRIMDAIAETQDMLVTPRIDDHERRIKRLEARFT